MTGAAPVVGGCAQFFGTPNASVFVKPEPEMRLNHIDLYSPSPKETAAFFLDCLDLRLVAARGKDMFFHLEDAAGMVVVISPPARSLGGDDQVTLNAQTYHIGFLLESRAEVDAVRARIVDKGFDMPPPRDMHGAYAGYVTIPGNILVEIAHRPPG